MAGQECAYCDRWLTPMGPVLNKYGMAYVYYCPTHGTYYVMDSPISIRGQVIVPDVEA